MKRRAIAVAPAAAVAPVPSPAPRLASRVLPTRRRSFLWLSLAFGLGLSLMLGLPWLLGLYAERLYREAVAELSAAGYRIAQDVYRRGWSESTAVLVIGAPDEAGAAAPRLQIASRIAHGPGVDQWRRWPPVLASARGRVTVIDGWRQLPPLHARAALEVGGVVVAALQLPGITYSGQAGSLHLVDGHGELRRGDDGNGWSGQGELPFLEATDVAGQTLAMRALGWRFALRGLSGGVPVGGAALTLDALRLDAMMNRPPLEVAGVLMRLETAVDAGRASAEAELRIDRLRVNGAAFAPSQLHVAVAGIDAPSLSSLVDGLRQLDARDLPESMRGLAIGALLTQSLPGLLSAAPRLELQRLELATPFGAVTADARLTVSGGGAVKVAPTAGDSAELGIELGRGQPLPWLQRLSGEAQVSAPQALVLHLMIEEQRQRVRRELRNRGESTDPLPARLEAELESAVQASLLSLIRDRWLLSDRGRLSAAAVLADGRLTLNGKLVPINGWSGT